MDWKRADTLLKADIARVAGKASDPAATLRALGAKVDGVIAAAEAHLDATRAKLDTLPVAVDEQHKTLAKLDAVIAKAQAEGRADLGAAATARRAKHAARAAAVEAELAGVDAEITRTEGYLERLGARRAEIAAAAEQAALSAPAGGGADDLDLGDGVGDEDLGFDIAALDSLGAAPPSTAARRGPPQPAAATTEAAATAAGAGDAGAGDDLDDEFAALLADMGEDVDLSAPAPTSDDGGGGVDDILAGLPALVEVGDGELPEGADPESDEPIDFSSLDDLPAVKSAAAKAGGTPARGELPAEAGAKPPAKAGAKPPAKAGAKPPAKAGASGGSNKVIWIVGGVVVAVGGGVAALFAFGVL